MLCKTVSSLQPDVGRGFLHVSNVFLFNLLNPGDVIWILSTLVQVMAWSLDGTKSLPAAMLTDHGWGPAAFTSGWFGSKYFWWYYQTVWKRVSFKIDAPFPVFPCVKVHKGQLICITGFLWLRTFEAIWQVFSMHKRVSNSDRALIKFHH